MDQPLKNSKGEGVEEPPCPRICTKYLHTKNMDTFEFKEGEEILTWQTLVAPKSPFPTAIESLPPPLSGVHCTKLVRIHVSAHEGY
jgi:hypothetical protein